MKIVVCIKQVPDTTEVRIDPVKGTLIRDGVESIINPDDKGGIELALQIKEEHGAHITVVTMGPPQAENALKEAYAMGVDDVVLLTDRAFAGSDTLATSLTLAAALRDMEYDLIIAGRQAIDGDTAQVGPQIAEHLGLPQVTYANGYEHKGDHAIVDRKFEGGHYRVKVNYPCLITTLAEMNTPRYMTVSGIVAANRDLEVKTITRADLDIADEVLGLGGSPTKVKASFTKGAKGKGEVFNLPANESVKVIVDKLREKFII